MNSLFIIVLDGYEINTIVLNSTMTIREIKNRFKKYLALRGKTLDDYTIKIYLDKIKELAVDTTDDYDNETLLKVWDQITQGYIVLQTNYLSNLYKDALYQIVKNVPMSDISNLCSADKRLNSICEDDMFWLIRTYHDFGVNFKPDNMSWKEFYKLASVDDIDTLLVDSARDGILGFVSIALDRGANIEEISYSAIIPGTALAIASYNGHLDVVKYLVDYGADVYSGDNSPLLWAVEQGHLDIIKYLVSQDVDVTIDNDAALREVIFTGNLEIVKYLVDQGADINASDGEPLLSAIENEYIDIVEYLVEQGADVSIDDNIALHRAVENDNLEIVKILVEHGADIHGHDEIILLNAITYSSPELIKYLVDQGADIHVNNDEPINDALKYHKLNLLNYQQSK